MFIVVRFNSKLQSTLEYLLSYIPSPKEEVRIFLYNYNDLWLGDLCVKSINLLFNSKLYRYIFFSFHFLLFYLFKGLRLYFFICFTFLQYDMRFLLYLAPLSFVLWLFDFFYYYHYWFITANLNYLHDMVNTTTTSIISDKFNFIIIKSWEDLHISLTPFGISQGFTTDPDDLFYLKSKFLHLSGAKALIQEYTLKWKFLDYIFLLCYFICWSYIVYYFFFYNNETYIAMGLLAIFRRGSSSFSNTANFHSTAPKYARDFRFFKDRNKGAALEAKTKGAFQRDHGVYGEEENGSYNAEGLLTHGHGTWENPSEFLHKTDIKGKQPQNHIPFSQEQKISPSDLSPPVPGSEAYFKQKSIKDTLDLAKKKKKVSSENDYPN